MATRLRRVLEPEVMDSELDAREYDSMDHSQVNCRFVQDLLEAGIGPDVLDLGTGTAQIPVELCRQDPHCRVLAVDLAISMLELARFNVEVAGLAQRIQLQHVDAKQLPFARETFSTVMSNSIVHHIPCPDLVMSEAVRVAAHGARLFFRDLVRPGSRAELTRLVDTYAGDASEHPRKMFNDSLNAALSLREIQKIVASLGFDKSTVSKTSDRHWTWSAVVEKH